jgi:hypothetical protein
MAGRAGTVCTEEQVTRVTTPATRVKAPAMNVNT